MGVTITKKIDFSLKFVKRKHTKFLTPTTCNVTSGETSAEGEETPTGALLITGLVQTKIQTQTQQRIINQLVLIILFADI